MLVDTTQIPLQLGHITMAQGMLSICRGGSIFKTAVHIARCNFVSTKSKTVADHFSEELCGPLVKILAYML